MFTTALHRKEKGIHISAPCIVCEGNEVKPLNIANGLSLVCCVHCGFIFVHPKPEPEKLISIYDETYFRNDESSVRGYTDYISDEANIRRTAQRRLKGLRPYLSSGRLLDVGCATGFFLDEARAQGWQVSGVDVSEFCVRYAGEHFSLDIHHGELTDLSIVEPQLDLITMWDVIEHVPSPMAYIRQAAKLLRRGGYLSLSTPDVASWPAKIFGGRWVGYKLSTEHVSYFNLHTLKIMLDENGFELIRYGHIGKHVPIQLFRDRLSLYFPMLASGLKVLEKALDFSDRSLYINPMDIIQVIARLR